MSISKAKAARLVRSLLDLFLDMEAATGQEVELCLECIEWAKAEKRTFLRQALEVIRHVPRACGSHLGKPQMCKHV